jgi:hypothetical protein
MWEDMPSLYLSHLDIFLTTQYCPGSSYWIYKRGVQIVCINDIINFIHLALGIDIDVIKDKLYANNKKLLCKIWKYFYPNLKYLRPEHPNYVE